MVRGEDPFSTSKYSKNSSIFFSISEVLVWAVSDITKSVYTEQSEVSILCDTLKPQSLSEPPLELLRKISSALSMDGI